MSKIVKIKGLELFDSRGNPTVGVELFTEAGGYGFAVVPSGASTGIFEAYELRDGGVRLSGKGCRKAAEHINSLIAPALVGRLSENGEELDQIMLELDGTETKKRLGANAILGVSIAAAKATADEQQIPLYKYFAGEDRPVLPIPMMNILNGGAHASNNLDIQEFMIQPARTDSFGESMEICVEIYHTLKALLLEKGLSTAVGDEGGFAPDLESDEAALELITEAILRAGYDTERVKICLDAAASEWYVDKGLYRLPKRGVEFDTEGLIKWYTDLCDHFPITSIEDGIGERDFEGFAELTDAMGYRIRLVGDDLFVTNEARLKAGLLAGAANAILIKPNQIGTLTETLKVINLAKEKGYCVIISHRSGDSEDSFIADLAVGTGAGYIKTGAPCRSERVSKYNRLLMIEAEL